VGEQLPVRHERCQYVQARPPHRCDGLNLSQWRPAAAIRLCVRETRLIDIGQNYLAAYGLLDQCSDFDLSGSEVLFIPLFLREWRVRFHTKPSSFNALRTTPCDMPTPSSSASRLCCSAAVAAPSRAQSPSCWVCSAVSLRAAPLRGKSFKPSKLRSNHAVRCSVTVLAAMSCLRDTSATVRPVPSNSTVRARRRSRRMAL